MNSKWDLLFDAVQEGSVAEIEEIIKENPAILKELGDVGQSIVHVAASIGNENVMKLLLKYPVDLEQKTLSGKNAIQIAKQKNHRNIVDLLEQRGKSVASECNVEIEKKVDKTAEKDAAVEDKVFVDDEFIDKPVIVVEVNHKVEPTKEFLAGKCIYHIMKLKSSSSLPNDSLPGLTLHFLFCLLFIFQMLQIM